MTTNRVTNHHVIASFSACMPGSSTQYTFLAVCSHDTYRQYAYDTDGAKKCPHWCIRIMEASDIGRFRRLGSDQLSLKAWVGFNDLIREAAAYQASLTNICHIKYVGNVPVPVKAVDIRCKAMPK